MPEIEVIGFNVLGYDEWGEAVEGSIPRLRCSSCGREWWREESRPCRCDEEEEGED
jgi:hypothetical protein